MKPCPYPVAAIVPHAAPMILLDEVLDYDETTMRAAVTIRESSLFATVQAYLPMSVSNTWRRPAAPMSGRWRAMPAHRCAWGSCWARVSTRSMCRAFSLGEHLIVAVHLIYRDDEMGSFDCRIDLRRSLCGRGTAERLPAAQ